MAFYIVKSSGQKEPFSLKKFRRSLRKAGARPKLVNSIVEKVVKMHPKSTQEIHEFATKALIKDDDRPIAARYNLKRALMELGPIGYPFESFIAQVFRAQGFTVKQNQIVDGKCTDHEIDVIAKKGNKHYIIECKFHNRPGLKSTIKVALYTQARFEDIQRAWEADPKHKGDMHQPWLVTNTRFTSRATDYARCMKMRLLSWNYPARDNLPGLLDQLGLHPITALTTLQKKYKRALIKQGCVLCRDVKKHVTVLKKLHITPTQIKKILEEAQAVCALK